MTTAGLTALTLLTRHRTHWDGCTLCPLSQKRRNVVLYRWLNQEHSGRANVEHLCDILFIGEAPGESENHSGRPFTGPSGNRLNGYIHDAIKKTGRTPLVMLTNVVCCWPQTPTRDTRPPAESEIRACRPRLEEFIRIVSPKVVVTVGSISKANLPPGLTPNRKDSLGVEAVYSIIHPSAISRMPLSRQPTAEARVILNIRTLVERHFK